jgi:hypothetical protein
MNTFRHIIKWPYYHPFFGETKIEQDGWRGCAESGLNIAFWSVVAGASAHLLGAKRPVLIGGAVFAAFVVGEVFLRAGGNHSGYHNLQLWPTAIGGASPTAAPQIVNPNYADETVSGYSEVSNGGYAEENDN